MMTSISYLPASHIFHHKIIHNHQNTYMWKEKAAPFDELIISWNGERPLKGYYSISVSLYTTRWSPWLDYAFWSVTEQGTFSHQPLSACCKSFQDTIHVLERNKATQFKICVTAHEGASLKNFRTLYACTTSLSNYQFSKDYTPIPSIHLDVSGLSQMTLQSERSKRMCSPTSTTSVINYLSASHIDPLNFADCVIDDNFDIYGNWVLNIAQASHHLGENWCCYVARFTSFNQILESLQKGFPVIVSIQGPLSGSAQPYTEGHLIVVKGFDADEQKVLCMDPAFNDNALTHVNYAVDEFLTAWKRRNGIAYLFHRSY